jgi:carboxyl-terminal processing protease
VNRTVHTLVVLLAGVAIGTGFALLRGFVDDRHLAQATPPPPTVVKPVRENLLQEVTDRIRREYVEQVPDARLEEAAVRGLIEGLDQHSAFLNAGEYEQMRLSTSGSYTGVGIEVAIEGNQLQIVEPIEGSPAALAGIQAGDIVLAVDDRPVEEGKLGQVVDRLRGYPGTRVKLLVYRKGAAGPLQFELQRSEVHVHTVRNGVFPGGYGYVQINHFSDTTPGDLRSALTSLQREAGAPLRGLVLDLRGNPGGVLEAAVEVADAFLEQGLIMRAEGRTADARFEMSATPGDLLAGAPIVTLIDRDSASGSEIVAGALRDHARSVLLGERSFGKGSVQTVIPLRGGQALKLTTSRYYTPSGASIHDTGLEPDIVVPSVPAPSMGDPVVAEAVQYLRDRSLHPRLVQATEP